MSIKVSTVIFYQTFGEGITVIITVIGRLWGIALVNPYFDIIFFVPIRNYIL